MIIIIENLILSPKTKYITAIVSTEFYVSLSSLIIINNIIT